MQNNPLVSIIITTYNRPDILPKTIESVLSQTFSNFELIIIDDCSEEPTKKCVLSFNDERIIYKRNTINLHLSASRNKGIEISSGSYVCFLDDDDIWHKDKLIMQIEKFQNLNDKYGLVYTWMNIVSGSKVVDKLSPIKNNDIFLESLHGQPISSASSWMIKKNILDNGIRFDENVKRGVDGDFLRQLAKLYYVEFIPTCLVDYQIHHGNHRITSSSLNSVKKSIEGNLITEKKFHSDLKKNPAIYSIFLQRILFEHLIVRNYIEAFKALLRSIYLAPFAYFRNSKVIIKIILFPFIKKHSGLND